MVVFSSRRKLFMAIVIVLSCALILSMYIYIDSPSGAASNIPSYSTKDNYFERGLRNFFLYVLNYKNYKSTTGGYVTSMIMDDSLPQDRDSFYAEITNDSASRDLNITRLLDYRNEFYLGSTALGSPQNMVCTKKNTKLGQILSFYLSLGRTTINHDVWSNLPEHSPLEGKQFGKCSIVGSSGILLNSKCGDEIDSADLILRFNLPRVNGFKDDVGERTHVVTANPSIFQHRYHGLKSEEHKQQFLQRLSEFDGTLLVPALAVSNLWSLSMKAAKVSKTQNNTKIVFGNPENYRAVWHFWKSAGHQSVLTSGFYMVTSLLNMCNETNLYGFWPFAETAEGIHVPYHYYEPKSPTATHHDMEKEFRMLWRFHQLDLLRLHFGQCTSNMI